MEEINKLIANKNFEQAEVLLNKKLEDNENDIESMKLLGLCYVNLQRFQEGQIIFETVVKLI